MSEATDNSFAQTFAKSGPWALLTFIILCAVGWKSNQLIDTYMTYVDESKNTTIELTSAFTKVHDVHSAQLVSLTALQTACVKSSNEHAKHEETMLQMLTLMQEAKNLMAIVPGQREEQLDLLHKIDIGIQELTTFLSEPSIVE